MNAVIEKLLHKQMPFKYHYKFKLNYIKSKKNPLRQISYSTLQCTVHNFKETNKKMIQPIIYI